MKGPHFPLTERLLLAKAFYDRGALLSTESWYGSESLALLALQDAAELALFVAAEHLKAPVISMEKFKDLLDKVDRELQKLPSSPRVTSRAQLLQMNTARVGLKHAGNRPHSADVLKWVQNTETFLTNLCEDALSIRFADLALSALVRHRRLARLLGLAEVRFADGRYFDSLCFSSKAVCLSRHESDKPRLATRGWLSLQLRSGPSESAAIEARVQRLEEVVDALAQGISMPDLMRFEQAAPRVQLSAAGTFWFASGGGKNDSPADARFCLDFATRTILELQDHGLLRPERYFSGKKTARTRVVAQGEVVENPDEREEVLRSVKPGDEVFVVLNDGAPQKEYGGAPDELEFATVIEDGASGCILVACLELHPERG